MRILFWSERFPPLIGGEPVSAAWLLRGLQDRGYEFAVIASSDDGSRPDIDEFEGMPVYRFPFATALAGIRLKLVRDITHRVAALKRSFMPDLLHLGFLGPSVLFHFQTLAAHTAPLLVSMDSGFPRAEIGADSLVGRAFRSADWITCVSAAGLERARGLAPDIRSRSSVIYKGRAAPALDLRPLPLDEPRLLCLGRLEPVKGFDLAITAFASLAARFPRLRLLIAGDGSVREDLERRARGGQIGGRVDFLGWVDPGTVPGLLNGVTMLVMPSRSEGLPQAALEAALMARPVVATAVGGLPEIIDPDRTGILVEPESDRALARGIAGLLDDPRKAIELGRAARVRAQEHFSLEVTLDQYDRLYRALVTRSHGRATS